jgi:acylphosphatase
MKATTHAIHAVVEGVVQGVGYRDARALGVAGWVRNRRDGTVEVLVHGTPEAVAAMQSWLHRGPRWARVDRVVVTLREPVDNTAPLPFERRPTG